MESIGRCGREARRSQPRRARSRSIARACSGSTESASPISPDSTMSMTSSKGSQRKLELLGAFRLADALLEVGGEVDHGGLVADRVRELVSTDLAPGPRRQAGLLEELALALP